MTCGMGSWDLKRWEVQVMYWLNDGRQRKEVAMAGAKLELACHLVVVQTLGRASWECC